MPKKTPSGKLTKLGDFENKVDESKLPGGKSEKFAIANKIGLMRGNKATRRGSRPATFGRDAAKKKRS